MGHWNHRVMKRANEHGETWYEIHEVFYDHGQGESEPRLSWTEEAIAPVGETLEELKTELERMLRACDAPVLDYGEEEKDES